MRFKLLLFILVSTIAHNLAADNAVNALWNEDSKLKMVGFWLYPDSGGCPDLRRKSMPLVLGGKIEDGVTLVEDLKYCYKLNVKNPREQIYCESGFINFTRNESNNTYSGSYSFVLSNGTKMKGNINAEFCLPDK